MQVVLFNEMNTVNNQQVRSCQRQTGTHPWTGSPSTSLQVPLTTSYTRILFSALLSCPHHFSSLELWTAIFSAHALKRNVAVVLSEIIQNVPFAFFVSDVSFYLLISFRQNPSLVFKSVSLWYLVQRRLLTAGGCIALFPSSRLH